MCVHRILHQLCRVLSSHWLPDKRLSQTFCSRKVLWADGSAYVGEKALEQDVVNVVHLKSRSRCLFGFGSLNLVCKPNTGLHVPAVSTVLNGESVPRHSAHLMWACCISVTPRRFVWTSLSCNVRWPDFWNENRGHFQLMFCYRSLVQINRCAACYDLRHLPQKIMFKFGLFTNININIKYINILIIFIDYILKYFGPTYFTKDFVFSSNFSLFLSEAKEAPHSAS